MLSKRTKLQDAIDSKILNQRKIFLWGKIDDESAKHVVDRLMYLEMSKPFKEIQLIINCPGGEVTSGFTIYDAIGSISSPVSTICTGVAASMGAIILSAGAKGRRFVLPNSRVMIHEPRTKELMLNKDGSDYLLKDTIRSRKTLKLNTEKTKELGAHILAENCNQTVDKIKKDFETDFWMSAEESLDYGIADGMLHKLI
ncbi:ClpP family protease [Wenyingzhuangia sp. IMCC45574]